MNRPPAVCEHCKKVLFGFVIPEYMKVFCDDGCLQSYVSDATTESKEDLLNTISYHDNRDFKLPLRNELEELGGE